MKKSILAGGILLAIGTTSGMAFASAEDEAAEVDPYAPETMRCERVAVTGSRVRRTRVCMTNAEWAAHREGTGRDARNLLDRSTIDSTNRNCPSLPC